MRIQTSDLPMLLLGTLPADRCKGHAQKIISCATTIRLQTLDLKTSQSALPVGQKKKFGWTFLRIQTSF